METVWVPVKNQKFDIGRTIDFLKCSECTQTVGSCDFLNCPNYGKQMTFKKYKVQEWFDEVNPIMWDREVLDSFMDYVAPKFPSGLYWQYRDDGRHFGGPTIEFDRMWRSNSSEVGSIFLGTAKVVDIRLSKSDETFLNRVAKIVSKANDLMWEAKRGAV